MTTCSGWPYVAGSDGRQLPARPRDGVSTMDALPFPVLIGDIGGTNARFAVVGDANAEMAGFVVVPTADFATIDDAIASAVISKRTSAQDGHAGACRADHRRSGEAHQLRLGRRAEAADRALRASRGDPPQRLRGAVALPSRARSRRPRPDRRRRGDGDGRARRPRPGHRARRRRAHPCEGHLDPGAERRRPCRSRAGDRARLRALAAFRAGARADQRRGAALRSRDWCGSIAASPRPTGVRRRSRRRPRSPRRD